MVAPAPVSALLHAVAVVKAGVFTILKVTIYIFGTDFILQSGASDWLIWFAAATILLASLVAMTKDNLKARLAYSTISQLSYVVLGAALGTPWSVIGGSMHIAMHAFGKITLFFCAGAVLVTAHKSKISELNGIGRRMPWTMGAFAIGAVSMIGAPPFAGFVSKWYILAGSFQLKTPSSSCRAWLSRVIRPDQRPISRAGTAPFSRSHSSKNSSGWPVAERPSTSNSDSTSLSFS